ncbi:Serpentine Receptor, class H [Caenorhabditis elegans]|uniref:Serpentine Receptor, class H n=1 Tax=Caenorhabditis elegans TaxID=6239 RepID=Q7YXA2_CAEEL|nr:Serpentine Receptor, class H [Caenorhabditis elegans]CAE11318.1 Serpentine Receptor, class H [Caenorhabditis elegans]|eukprot:NP_001024122.1 Serpentine Receptor, class H [Caenorhabditis elegans]
MCTWRENYLESSDFYVLSSHILSFIQMSINILGFYIIIFKTPKTLQPVKFSILVMHITCFWLDFNLSTLSIPYLIYSAAAGQSFGILAYLKIPMSFQFYMGATAVFLLGPAILLFFEERYDRLLRRDANTRSRFKKRVAYFLVNYPGAFTIKIPVVIDVSNSEQSRHNIAKKFPCIPSRIITDPGFYVVTEDLLKAVLLHLGILTFTTVQVLYFFYHTVKYLFKSKIISESTKRLQKQLFKALCIQVTIPTIAIFIPCVYLNTSAALDHLDMIENNTAIIFLSLHGSMSTITTLLVHKSYRKAVIKLILQTKIVSKPVTINRVSIV